jgi:hypothetical protein
MIQLDSNKSHNNDARTEEQEKIQPSKEKDDLIEIEKAGIIKRDKDKRKEKELKNIIKEQHTRIIMEGDDTPKQFKNDIEEYRTIESNEAAVRKEKISKESMYISKRWENMDQKQIERKLWLD